MPTLTRTFRLAMAGAVAALVVGLAAVATAADPIRVDATEQWAVFSGQRDTKVPAARWRANLDRQVANTCAAITGFPNVDFGFDVPRTSLVDHITFFLPSSKLFTLVATDLVPSAAPNNPYVKLTHALEPQLAGRIMAAAPQSLEPADLTRLALQVTHGSYPLAVLTAHNLLKTITKTGRESRDLANKAWGTKVYPRRFAEAVQLLSHHNLIATRLKSLRPAGTSSNDKLGPWYHIYAVLTIAALQGPIAGTAAAVFEHGAKWFKAFKNEGGFNAEKAAIDLAFTTVPTCISKGLAGNVSGEWKSSRYGCAVFLQQNNGVVRGSLTYPNGGHGTVLGRIEGRILYYRWKNGTDQGDGKLWVSVKGNTLKGYFQNTKGQYGDWSLTRTTNCKPR